MFLISLICQNWQPNSFDVSRIDYSIWGALQQLVYHQKIKNINRVKQEPEKLVMINQELISDAIGQWPKRLLLVIHSHVGLIAHRFH